MKDINKSIENLEEIVNLINEELDKQDKNVSAILDLKDLLSLRNLIKAYKELKEENRIFALEASRVRLKKHIDENYIPVSLVEEKIEELKETLKHYGEYNKLNLLEKVNVDLIDARIEVLQELLEKRE